MTFKEQDLQLLQSLMSGNQMREYRELCSLCSVSSLEDRCKLATFILSGTTDVASYLVEHNCE